MEIIELRQLCDIYIGKSPKELQKHFVSNNGIPFINISDIKENRVTNSKYFIRKDSARLSKIAIRGDLLLTINASPGYLV